MRRIITLFDYTKNIPIPLMSLVLDKTAKLHYFYLKGTNKKIYDIENSLSEFRELFNEPCMINDFKSHVVAFNLDRKVDYNVYDVALQPLKLSDDPKKTLIAAAKKFGKPMEWMKIRANASVIYQGLEDLGILFFNAKRFPIYNINTFTGRSSTTDFNIQGTTVDDDIRPISSYAYFVHFDWVTADLRMAAIMSGDETMLRSYNTSDPYDYLSEAIGVRRNLVKRIFLKSMYSFKFDHPVFEAYPKFKIFLNERLEKLRSDGYLDSILGRRFYISGDRKELSVFNAQFQGSVAHMMQIALIRLYKLFPEFVFTEMHDSIVMSCNLADIKRIMNESLDIMVNPIDDYIMPVKVSVGRRWKRWKGCKEKRN